MAIHRLRQIYSAEPFAYLKATLDAVARGHPSDRLDDLLPWNFRPASSKYSQRGTRTAYEVT